MKESIHVINGKSYTFTTIANKTHLIFKSKMRPASENHVEVCTFPNCKIITRSTGEILFALKINREAGDQFEILTAQQLYDHYAWQWFEPLADNYHELIYLNEGPETHTAYKHFSWQDIVDFSEVDRPSYQFYKEQEGDWKHNSSGGDGYLMVTVNGYPYWTDAVGQIPYAVDTFRSLHNVSDVVETGMTFATTKPADLLAGKRDMTSSYDNFFVLRGAIYASKRFSYQRTNYTSSVNMENGRQIILQDTTEIMHEIDAECLSNAITQQELDLYGKWVK
ncbi:hypothetical protein OH773_10980 [Buttiauxella sp. WJP83]|uniref:hypothetical protein n=1 Tax=Buttiauxella sp. WJP83 TaxID=2986951 RepID=UPI0022DD9E94|nr:hypothetical protein [Buttiauxella sp. WJP83]WBM68740.1 hypothetical protein OH773_10980 [Buttiauxella sp. WJP83]